MRVGEFFEALHAYQEKELADRRHMGELARGAALRLFNINLRRQDKIRDPRQFWLMPWDETPEDENSEELERLNKLTDEDMDEQARAFLQSLK